MTSAPANPIKVLAMLALVAGGLVWWLDIVPAPAPPTPAVAELLKAELLPYTQPEAMAALDRCMATYMRVEDCKRDMHRLFLVRRQNGESDDAAAASTALDGLDAYARHLKH